MTEFVPDVLDAFVREIAARTGIVVRDRDRGLLAGKLRGRVRASGHRNSRAYHDWLLAAPEDLDRPESARGREWQAIVQCVSIVESYLFRDRGQFQLLREQILPQAIERRRRVAQQTGNPPRLRLWSAACATGEEPYSLAILVRELLPDLENWDVRIVATDINEAALEVAQRGVYSEWSFRQVEASIRERYFQHRATSDGDRWRLAPEIARLVSFHPFNLARSAYPDSALHLNDLDLILCRNVFIYLNSGTIRRILAGMVRALHTDGYLLTAHAELQHQDTADFKVHLCPQSAIYQPLGSQSPPPNTMSTSLPDSSKTSPPRAADPRSQPPRSIRPISSAPAQSPQRLPLPSVPRTPLPRSRTAPPQRSFPPTAPPVPTSRSVSPASTAPPSCPAPPQAIPPGVSAASRDLAQAISVRINTEPERDAFMQQAIEAFRHKAYERTIAILKSLLERFPQQFEACDLLALAYANLGEYNRASYYCTRALEIDPCATTPNHLLAHLAENSGNIARAKLLLKRVVYLDPTAVLAYLDLSALYATEGDAERARKMEKTAHALLAQRDADEILDPYRQLSIGALREQLRTPSPARERHAPRSRGSEFQPPEQTPHSRVDRA